MSLVRRPSVWIRNKSPVKLKYSPVNLPVVNFNWIALFAMIRALTGFSEPGPPIMTGFLPAILRENVSTVGKKPLERRPLHRPAGKASVVVHIGKRDPSGMTLAHDIGLASLPLGVERIELLLESLIGRLSGVDRTTEGEPGSGSISPSHDSLSRLM